MRTNEDGWREDTRTSYNNIADSYADLTSRLLDETPEERAVFASFADLVRTQGAGPVVDVGCGTGRITAHLSQLGVEVFGIDLSPAMIEVARRDHPGLRFDLGCMTSLALADASMAGLLAWYSLIHIPDDEIRSVFTHFQRVLRPGGPLLVGFHVGDESQLLTQGYGGHPMNLYVHRRRHNQMHAWLEGAGFVIDAYRTLSSAESKLGGIILAHRRVADPER
ncbi:class I SAM-dependent methyltransferase [Nocardia salmonicida]|uniref:class I SAM-dependent DNA methyltransferase n=1 Tax=Nocardia salmonicida TaxID=53431 RepID=UPI003407E6E1